MEMVYTVASVGWYSVDVPPAFRRYRVETLNAMFAYIYGHSLILLVIGTQKPRRMIRSGQVLDLDFLGSIFIFKLVCVLVGFPFNTERHDPARGSRQRVVFCYLARR